MSTSKEPSFDLNESSEIANIKALISSATIELDDHLSKEDVNKDVVKALLHSQLQEKRKLQELNELLTSLFQKAINELTLKQSQCEELCAFEVDQLQKEINVFSTFLNTGSKTSTESDLTGCFSKLTCDVKENCPLLFNMLCNIFLHKKDGRAVSEFRVKSAVHALAILVSLRSQKLANDFKLMFTYLCISFGAGCRFITMMNHLGLTVSWEKAIKFFNEQQKRREKDIAQLSPADIPVILMIDNINIYRRKRKHLRWSNNVELYWSGIANTKCRWNG